MKVCSLTRGGLTEKLGMLNQNSNPHRDMRIERAEVSRGHSTGVTKGFGTKGRAERNVVRDV